MSEYNLQSRALHYHDSPGMSPCIVPLELSDMPYTDSGGVDGDGFLLPMKSTMQDEDQRQFDLLMLVVNTGDTSVLSHLPVPDQRDLDSAVSPPKTVNNPEDTLLTEVIQRDALIKRQQIELDKIREQQTQERESARLERENWKMLQFNLKDQIDSYENSVKSLKGELEGKKMQNEQLQRDVGILQKEIVGLNKVMSSNQGVGSAVTITSSISSMSNNNTSVGSRSMHPELTEKLEVFFDGVRRQLSKLRSEELVRSVLVRLINHAQDRSGRVAGVLPLNSSSGLEGPSPSVQRRGSQQSLRSPAASQRRSAPNGGGSTGALGLNSPGGFRPLNTPLFFSSQYSGGHGGGHIEPSTTPLNLSRAPSTHTPLFNGTQRSLSLLVTSDLPDSMECFDETLEDGSPLAKNFSNNPSTDRQQAPNCFSFIHEPQQTATTPTSNNNDNSNNSSSDSIIQTYFYLLCKSLALEYVTTAPKHLQHTMKSKWNVSPNILFLESIKQQVPFYRFHVFIRQALHRQALVLSTPELALEKSEQPNYDHHVPRASL